MKRTITMIMMMLLLTGAVSALSITSPESKTYEYNEILLAVEGEEVYENMYYSINNGVEEFACSNCSGFNDTIIFPEGENTITVFAELENETINETVQFNLTLPPPFSIAILNPENKIYASGDVPVSVLADKELEIITITIDDEILKCENCSELNDTLNLSEGTYTLIAEGTLDNKTINKTVNFEVKFPVNNSFSIEIINPKNTTYTNLVPVHVESTKDLDNITVEVNGVYSNSCTECDELIYNLNLSTGNYTLKVKGVLGNETREAETDFRVLKDYKEEEYGEPRFDTGFNKLPQAYESGELTDAELALIIRNNNLNPGVLNRLIKTGMLGNESISAILDTQFKPRGIFFKLFGWLGFKENTYSSEIYETYNLTEKQEQKIIQREDLPKKYSEQVKEKLKNKVNIKTQTSESDESDSKNKPVISQGKPDTPPGLAKKESNGKVPPGLEKKK